MPETDTARQESAANNVAGIRKQASLRMLLLVVFIYALTFALVVAVPLPAYQQVIVIGVVTLFVLGDLFLFGLQ